MTEKNNKALNRIVYKITFVLLTILLWIPPVVLSIEIVLQIYQKVGEINHPWIKQLDNRPPWSYSASRKEPIEEREKQPVLPPEKWNLNRAQFFLQLDEGDKHLFATVYRLNTFIQKYPEKTRYFYPSEAENAFSNKEWEEFLILFHGRAQFSQQKEYSEFYEEYLLGSQKIKNLFLFQVHSENGSYTQLVWYSKYPESTPSHKTNILWEIPFFEYKKHVELPNEEFHTNNFGFRDEDVIVPKPENVYRIVCLGGSTTEEGPTQDETYPNLVEQSLNRECAYPIRFDVVNAGVPGISLTQIWLRTPDFLLMQPDCIILCEGINDITHNLLPQWLNTLSTTKRIILNSILLKDLLLRIFFVPPKKIVEDIQNNSIRYIQKICDYYDQHKVHVIIMSIPAPNYSKMSCKEKQYYDYTTRRWWGGPPVDYRMYEYVLSFFNRQLKDTVEKSSSLYIPLYEIFNSESPHCFSDLCHMKMEGIRKKASVITHQICNKLDSLLRTL